MGCDKFDMIVQTTFIYEGGYSDHPDDPGGPTNFGISLRFLETLSDKYDLDHDGVIDANDIKKMTKQIAAQIYKNEFWEKCECSQMPCKLAAAVFDAAVNLGTGRAVIMLQQELNKYCDQAGFMVLELDGRVGKFTLEAINKLENKTGEVVDGYLQAREEFYERLAQKRPGLAVFLPGWKKRVASLRNLISGLA
ncbi:MAG: hypothetical protein HQK59_12010 [Deltaproteobacteria bacterium]|nr:hypothetical protein [Deltaproteobacteria bacterium]